MSDLPRRTNAERDSAVRISTLQLAFHHAIEQADHDGKLTDAEITMALVRLMQTMVGFRIKDERSRSGG